MVDLPRLEFDKRKAHVKRLFAVTKDSNGEEEDRSMWIDMYRIDQFTYVDEKGIKFLVYLLWEDEPTDPAQTTKESEENLHKYGREISTKRLTDPQSDLESGQEPDFWFNIPIIDMVVLEDRTLLTKNAPEVRKLKFINDNPELISLLGGPEIPEGFKVGRRKIWIRRVTHWDTDKYPDEENVYVPALEYERSGDEDTDQYIDQEVPQIVHIEDNVTPTNKRFTVVMFNFDMAKNFRNKTIEDIKEEREAKLPPIRLDPFQQVINCQLFHEPKRPTDTIVFHVWETSDVDGSPPNMPQAAYEDAYITEDNDGDKDETGKKLKYVRGGTAPPEPDFEKLKWPKIQRERGRFLIAYQDDDGNSWRLYIVHKGVDYYKNGVFNLRVTTSIEYAKKVGKKEIEKFHLTEDEAKDAFHTVQNGGVYIWNPQLFKELNAPIRSIEHWTDDFGDDLAQSGTASSDYEGNSFMVVLLASGYYNEANIHSWNKWGEMRWIKPHPINHTAPLMSFLLVSTPGIDDYVIYGVWEPAAPQWGTQTFYGAYCIGLCYVYYVNNQLSVTEGNGETVNQFQFPDQDTILGLDTDGNEILREQFQDNSIISTATDDSGGESTATQYGGTDIFRNNETLIGYNRYPII